MKSKKLAKDQILNHTVTVLAGKAGSGKTLLAMPSCIRWTFQKTL